MDGVIVGILVGIGTIALIVCTAGIGAAILGATISLSLGTIALVAVAGVSTGYIAGVYYENTYLPDDLELPMYNISAEEIFKGEIGLFDIDFFNAKEIYFETDGYDPIINQIINNFLPEDHQLTSIQAGDYKVSDYTSEDIDKFSQRGIIKRYFYYDEDGNKVTTSRQNTANELRGVVSQWYNALRNIAIVLMLSILLYVGIRMLLTTIASDKAKYKQMLTDWLVGICLLFFMHYIMAFSVTLVNQFVKVIKSTYDTEVHSVTLQTDDNGKIAEKVMEAGKAQLLYDEDGNNLENGDDPKDATHLIWPTNLMGRMRVELQMRTGRVSYVGYAICFIMLVVYTVFFAFTYLKRVIYMAFLTIISPLVAMTYPIDKINDGQAQAFNKWIREYIFNLLIQPLHLLLYTMLVSTAFQFAGKNVWYMIVAIGFLLPAEKLLRSFFGFEKASTPGSLAGVAVGAGLLSRGMGTLLRKVPGGLHQKDGKNGIEELGESTGDSANTIRYAGDNFDAGAAILGIGQSQEENGPMERNENAGANDPIRGNAGAGANDPIGGNAGARANTPIERNTNSRERNSNRNISDKTKRRLRAAKAGGKVLLRGAMPKIGRMGKKAIRFAGGAAAATAAGTIGVALGAATGDFQNALQYGAAGVGAGAYAGSRAADFAINTTGNIKNGLDGAQQVIQGAGDAMQREYYGEEEYQRRQIDKQIKEWKKNKRYKSQLEDKLGIDATQKMYEEGDIDKYLSHGISDVNDIATIHQFRQESNMNNIDEAIGIHEYAQMIGDTTKMKKKDQNEWKATVTEKFQNYRIIREIGYGENR